MKKFLLSLCVGFLGIISFCNAGTYTVEGNGCFGRIPIPVSSYGDCNFTVNCTFTTTDGSAFLNFRVSNFYGNGYNLRNGSNLLGSSIVAEVENPAVFSYDFSTYTTSNSQACLGIPFLYNSSCSDYSNGTLHYSCVFSGDKILSVGGSCPTCPEVNTGEILSGYILESEIDTNYCVGNGLCPNECGSGTDFSGDLQYSNLFINNILHPGTENIFLNIQDNIFWDYSESESGLIIDVGSGYDQDYIDGVIDVQSYRPTSEDFTQTFVGGLILFTPYVVILLFVILVWNLIKKIFKTK